MNKRLLLAALALLSTANLASASEVDPDHFWLGILRKDGVLTPFAFYDKGNWSTPWPAYLEVGESGQTKDTSKISLPAFEVSNDYRLSPKTASLDALPAAWTGGIPGMPTRWYLWPREGHQQLIEVTKATQYESHCVYNWGLLADYPDAETARPNHWPRPKAGIVSSTSLEVSPMVKADIASEESRQTLSLIRMTFHKLEAKRISNIQSKGYVGSHLKYTGHPVSEQERDKSEFLVERIVKNATPMNGRTIYYVEMRRHYRKPEHFSDQSCDGITWFTGWLLKDNGRFSILNTRASLTDCDMKGADSADPDHMISVGANDYVVSVNYGYESEYYTVGQITNAGLRQLVSRSGGGC
ncbi:MAG: hypothetical protein ACE5HM_00425 [Acidiferrobacterales bacterium]